MKIEKIKTNDGLSLHGLSFGNITNNTCYIIIHGLGSSLWSHVELAQSLVNESTSVLLFNNRGFGVMNTIKVVDPQTGVKSRKLLGAAVEVFEESLLDIEGALRFASDSGASEMVLIGFSTGSNKIIHYLKYNKKAIIKKAVLISPLNDYLDAIRQTSQKKVQSLIEKASEKASNTNEIIYFLDSFWSKQRILSLFKPDSNEQVFRYDIPHYKYTVFQEISTPLQFIIGSNDEFADRAIEQILHWFEINKKKCDTIVSIQEGTHSLKGYEEQLVNIIKTE